MELANDKHHLIYVYIAKANILNKMGQYEEALAYTEKTLSLEPNNKQAEIIKKQALAHLKSYKAS